MIDYYRVHTPTHEIYHMDVKSFIQDLKDRLNQTKIDNKRFNHKCKGFLITKDSTGVLWISGYTKEDLKKFEKDVDFF